MIFRTTGLGTAALLLLLSGAVAQAEEGILVLQVSAASGEPLRGIQIGILGGHKDLTDDFGEIRLRLPRGVGPGQAVDLQLGAQRDEPEARWVFLDPWLTPRVVVPSSEQGTAGVVQVVLARRGDRTLLESQAVVQTVVSRLMSQLLQQIDREPGSTSDPEARRVELREEMAAALGVSVAEMDRAIRSTFEESQDPLESGLLAFYEANYAEAEQSFRQAREKARQKVTDGEEELATANLHLGQTLLVQGQYREALSVLTEAAELQPADRTTKWALAKALYSNGHYGESAQRWRELLEDVRPLGAEHPDTLSAMGNLAGTLKDQGDLSGARELAEEVLSIRRRVLGAEHPDTLGTMGNLAVMLWAQGDLSGSRELAAEVLSIRRRVLSAEHPDTLMAMGNLAVMLRAQGDLPGARELEEEVLSLRRRVLGAEHPDTLATMGNLAATLWTQGDLSGARELEEEVLASRRRVLGAEHPDTLSAMANLAVTLKAQSDVSGARELEEEVLSIRRRVLGEEHPDTMVSRWNLAITVARLRDSARIESLLPPLCSLMTRASEQLSGDEKQIVAGLTDMGVCTP